MLDNPESPSSRADRSNDVRIAQAPSSVSKEQKNRASEKPNPFETVPEAPTLTKQILVSNSYKMYQYPFDASDKTNGKESDAVPAIFSIVGSTLKGRVVQVTNGKETFWINTEEAKAQDWSVKQGFQKNEQTLPGRTELRMYMQADNANAPSAKVKIPPNTFFPAFDIGKKSGPVSWKKIGIDLQGKTTELKTMPLWTNDVNEKDQVLGESCYFVSEKDLRQFFFNLKQCKEAFALLSASERKSSDQILDALQLSYLPLFGARAGSTDGARQTLEYVKGKTGGCSDFLNLTLDDISRMDDRAYQQWLNRLEIGVKRVEELLSIRGKNSTEVLMDGTKTRFFIIPFEQLP